jgi:hypothetical protein
MPTCAVDPGINASSAARSNLRPVSSVHACATDLWCPPLSLQHSEQNRLWQFYCSSYATFLSAGHELAVANPTTSSAIFSANFPTLVPPNFCTIHPLSPLELCCKGTPFTTGTPFGGSPVMVGKRREYGPSDSGFFLFIVGGLGTAGGAGEFLSLAKSPIPQGRATSVSHKATYSSEQKSTHPGSLVSAITSSHMFTGIGKSSADTVC